jgi:hypothetical protein
MPSKRGSRIPSARTTRSVNEEVFRMVYDSPHALPGKEKWVTSDDDVRLIERLLGLEARTIGAPLWVSGDTRSCPSCGRERSWLDIVSSSLARVHNRAMLVQVLLGDKKYVNTEVPRAIADLVCYQCQAPITDLRSFKCHNWAYAHGALVAVIEQLTERQST